MCEQNNKDSHCGDYFITGQSMTIGQDLYVLGKNLFRVRGSQVEKIDEGMVVREFSMNLELP